MKFKKNGGFTLVELIVVIAIMAILAGVAVPVYSGYIEKAQMAGDQQLLGAVNSAFAAACVENGTDVYEITSASVSMGNAASGDGKVITGSNPYSDAFMKYYAGNETAAFKGGKPIVFDATKHVFVILGSGSDSVTLSYAGGTITISAELAEALSTSTYGEMGAETLLGKVDYVTTLAAQLMEGDLSNSTFAQLISGPEYGALLADILNIDVTTEEGQTEFVSTVGTMVSDKMDLLIANGTFPADADRSEGSDLYNAAYNQIVANNAVLNAAQNTDRVSGDILGILAGENATSAILQTVNSDSGAGLAQAAMAYGLYTAYASQNGITVSDDPSEVLAQLDADANFKAYASSEQAQTDLEGYLAAMNMINNNVNSNTGAVSDILVNGFANEDLVGLLQQVINK